MYRYFVILDYNGSAFHGWQYQPNATSVQEVVEKAFSTLLKESTAITGCGRTDTGVHAINYVAHFDSSHSGLQGNVNLIYKLNRFLPREIALRSIKFMHPEAHSRFDATSRTYRYYISRKKDPFYHAMRLNFLGALDISLMNRAAQELFNYTDFTSFSKVDTDVKTNNCKIMEAYWTETGDQLVFTIKADRFLRNMVRAIVGTLFEVGLGKISMEEFCQIIEAKDRCQAGHSMLANALFLEKVEYPYPIV
ncbi:MAG TPA: tRNA pseudouridine(38-40) synthase TruA [Marinilabiliales bacterium]|nr:MAG: tRNA pseudouridine(38-40) synthase TruA [Bacteroidetes bacterium GWA2_40_14]OFX57705.1 MAG: tRNA pseudouridine(38-40) synthase TruA [Bacteroidetes bacterium GWC2_40_13]OFX71336.1 MAG: tRNA pseudouridine(38-40) synthase TruA [Bacteroidetes bacterium GWD2_40_43]OFX91469.1 MAG: tRNA pseudouridine(38-40) synthase TruA [Bacteroidetes bacterium GWE2_40_63]OFY19539.1 MAG: tRNA pseudouridine(38-40) synthase TruA [Bacteroidetes bacterium GWF2_40_13]OFZ32197.1 MAG: tRNA pseudouridine(38-40) synt